MRISDASIARALVYAPALLLALLLDLRTPPDPGHDPVLIQQDGPVRRGRRVCVLLLAKFH